jgi:hypothetical protein
MSGAAGIESAAIPINHFVTNDGYCVIFLLVAANIAASAAV